MNRKALMVVMLLGSILTMSAEAQHRPKAQQKVVFGVLKRPPLRVDSTSVPIDSSKVDSTQSGAPRIMRPS